MYLRKIICWTIVSVLLAVGQAHAFINQKTTLSGESFVEKPLSIKRLAIVIVVPRIVQQDKDIQNYKEKVADALKHHFSNTFQKLGVEVWSTIQPTHRLPKDQDVDLAEASQFKPDAFLLLKKRRLSAMKYSRVTISNLKTVYLIEIFDANQKGVWRGNTQTRKLELNEDSSRWVEELVKQIIDSKAIEVMPKGNNK